MTIQPIRPNDASGIYRRQISDTGAPEAGARAADGRPTRGPRRTDEVTISEQARRLRRVMEAVRDAPATSPERVASFRDLLARGLYEVDADAIAARLLDGGAVR